MNPILIGENVVGTRKPLSGVVVGTFTALSGGLRYVVETGPEEYVIFSPVALRRANAQTQEGKDKG